MSSIASSPKRYKSRLAAFLNLRCPRCHEGPAFVSGPYHPKFQKMHERCPVCDLKYEIEPGFFWGSMYVSYTITVVIFLVVAILTYTLLNDPEVWVYLLILFGVLLFASPLVFRYSRMIMLYIFASVDFDPEAGRK